MRVVVKDKKTGKILSDIYYPKHYKANIEANRTEIFITLNKTLGSKS